VPDTGFLSRRKCSFSSVTFISSITAKYSEDDEEENKRRLLPLLLVVIVVAVPGRRNIRRAAAAVKVEEGTRADRKAAVGGRPRHRHKEASDRMTILHTGIFLRGTVLFVVR
jgi:hypothetical protein